MKILFALHGYPPELVGGTEHTVRAQARGLVRRGVEVVVVAGSMQWQDGFRTTRDEDVDPATGASHPVYRIHRDDLYFDHWQKSAEPRVARAFRAILESERPDVVHVQHWIRLTRDLVATAARAGIPSVVTLHDLWTTCLLTFRVQPGATELCRERAGFSPCVACAGRLPPRTPWVGPEGGAIAFAEHAADLARELDLARAIITPSRTHAETIERFLGRAPGSLRAQVVPPGRDLALARREPLAPPAESGRLVLGAWGHLHPLKGADVVLAAIRALERPERVTLHLAGGEVDRAFAVRLAKEARGLDVVFHGAFDDAALGAHPATAVHAMVSGSRAHESWGLVLDEAWCMGLPAVLPDAGAFGERARSFGGALLYTSGDPASLAGALARLLEEPHLWSELCAAVPAHACPTVEESVVELERIYAAAVSAGPPQAPADQGMLDLVRERARVEWDRSLSRRTPRELGFEEAGP